MKKEQEPKVGDIYVREEHPKFILQVSAIKKNEYYIKAFSVTKEDDEFEEVSFLTSKKGLVLSNFVNFLKLFKAVKSKKTIWNKYCKKLKRITENL